MKLSNNGRDRALTYHLLSPSEASSIGIGLYLFQLFTKGSHWNHQATQAVSNTIDCSPKSD